MARSLATHCFNGYEISGAYWQIEEKRLGIQWHCNIWWKLFWSGSYFERAALRAKHFLISPRNGIYLLKCVREHAPIESSSFLISFIFFIEIGCGIDTWAGAFSPPYFGIIVRIWFICFPFSVDFSLEGTFRNFYLLLFTEPAVFLYNRNVNI